MKYQRAVIALSLHQYPRPNRFGTKKMRALSVLQIPPTENLASSTTASIPLRQCPGQRASEKIHWLLFLAKLVWHQRAPSQEKKRVRTGSGDVC